MNYQHLLSKVWNKVTLYKVNAMLWIWWLAASKGSNLHWLCLVIEIFRKQTNKIFFAKLWVIIKQTDSKPAWKFLTTCMSNIFFTNVKSSERLLIWSCHLLPRRKNSRSRPCILLRLLLFFYFFFHKDKSCNCNLLTLLVMIQGVSVIPIHQTWLGLREPNWLVA